MKQRGRSFSRDPFGDIVVEVILHRRCAARTEVFEVEEMARTCPGPQPREQGLGRGKVTTAKRTRAISMASMNRCITR